MLPTATFQRVLPALLAGALGLSGLALAPMTSPAGAGSLPLETGEKTAARAEEAYGQLPTSFAANQGQAQPEVKFLAGGPGYSLALTASEAVLSLATPGGGSEGGRAVRPEAFLQTRERAVVRMRLEGAKPNPAVIGLDQLPGDANYLIGPDPSKWHTDVPTYAKVAYRGVYPGVDVVWYGHEGTLEHDFVLAPGADPAVIKVVFEGADRLELNGDILQVHLPGGETLTERIPGIYQTVGGERRPVDGQFRLLAGNQVGFDVERYDHTRPLVIDPILDYSSYLGGSGSADSFDSGADIAVDAAGAAYITGFTSAASFPVTAGAFQTTLGGAPSCLDDASCSVDAFVTKLDPTGSTIVYSTYLGGSGSEGCCGASSGAIAVDASGAAYVVGATNSSDFPTTAGALDSTIGGATCGGLPPVPCGDGFLAKLDPTGSTLAYSTYLGGDGDEFPRGVAVDGTGVYVTGSTGSADFPITAGAFQPIFGGDSNVFSDAFIAKFDTTASGAASLVYSTYLGGDLTDEGNDIAVDGAGNAYVTGGTQTFLDPFPIQNPIASACAGTCGTTDSYDAFVTKINPTGTSLVYSTLLGGSGTENGFGGGQVTVDTSGAAYVTGSTESTDFPTLNAFQATFGGSTEGFGAVDAFIAKIDPLGSTLVYSTYLGGNGQDEPGGIAVEPDCLASCSAYVTGFTFVSTDFPTQGAFQPNRGGDTDAFVSKLAPAGDALMYSTYLGGNGSDGGGGIAVDAAGAAYVTGGTGSQDFPTQDSIQGTFNLGGDFDAFVTKFAPDGSELVYSTYLGGFVGEDVGLDIAVDSTGAAYVTGATGSIDFPATGGSLAGTSAGNLEAFVSKLNPTGTALEYSTFLGGRGDDEGEGIAVDGGGNAYVTGSTGSPNFPTAAGSFQDSALGSIDAFAVKLNATGSALLYSTFLGGSDFDLGNTIAIDDSGAAYVAGTTRSADLATTGTALQDSIAGSLDAFVTKLDPDGMGAAYVTYLGGSEFEEGRAIAVDGDGAAYIAGFTFSDDFPTPPGAFQQDIAGGFDVYVSKLNAAGSALVYSTYLGGTERDDVFGAHSIAVDGDGAAYVIGTTGSADFPTTTGAFDRTINEANFGPDAFVTKLNPAGSALVYSTYLGGAAFEFGNGIAVDATGSAYVTGTTGSLITFPMRGFIEGTPNPGGEFDVFVTRLSPAGNTVVSSVLVGGSGIDEGISIAVDPAGAVYVTGFTESDDFPTTPGAPQTISGGGTDAFVFKMAPPTGVSVFISDDPDFLQVGQDLTYTVEVLNIGPDPAPAGILQVTLPFPPATSDPACEVAGSVLSCDVPGLAPGETYIVQVTVVPTEAGTFIATAEIFIGVPGDDPTDNVSTAQTTIFPSGLAVSMSDTPDPVLVGEPLTYSTDIFNLGPGQSPVTSLEVTLPFPPASVSDPLCVEAGFVLACDIPSLAPGEAYNVQATVVPTEIGTVEASAEIFPADPFDESSDNVWVEETVVLPPDEAPDLPPGRALEGTGPLTAISGNLDNINDVDLYRICITGDTFSASTVDGAQFDTQLFVFNDDGTGKVANKDDAVSGTFQSRIAGPTYTNGNPLTFVPGPYLLAISSSDEDPLDDQGQLIFPGPAASVVAPLPVVGPLAAWSGGGDSVGAYTIALTGATFIGEAPCLEAAYDDDPGDVGFDFDTPFDDAGPAADPAPLPSGNPGDVAAIIGAFSPSGDGQLPDPSSVPDAATRPVVAPQRLDELPRTGPDMLPIGLAAWLFLAGRTFSAMGRRRRARTSSTN